MSIKYHTTGKIQAPVEAFCHNEEEEIAIKIAENAYPTNPHFHKFSEREWQFNPIHFTDKCPFLSLQIISSYPT